MLSRKTVYNRLLLAAVWAGVIGCSSVPREWSQASTLSGHTGNCFAIAISPDKRLVATGSHDGSTRVWNRVTGQCVRVLQVGDAGASDVAFFARGKFLAATGHDTCAVWDTRNWELKAKLACEPTVMATNTDGPLLVLGLESGELLLYDAARGVEVARRKVFDSRVIQLAASPDFKTVVCSHEDVVKVSIPELSIEWRSAGHDPKVIQSQIIVEPKFGIAITSSYDSTARVWDLSTGKCDAGLRHESSVLAMSLSADGRRLLTNSAALCGLHGLRGL